MDPLFFAGLLTLILTYIVKERVTETLADILTMMFTPFQWEELKAADIQTCETYFYNVSEKQY